MKRLKEIKLAKYPEPKMQHLSKENQKKLVEGCMNYVFKYTRHYYKLFNKKIPEENLYYLFLETLMKIAKYIVHNGKLKFHSYVITSMKNNIRWYIADLEKISFEEANRLIYNYIKNDLYRIEEFKSAKLNDEKKEELVNPFELNYLLENKKVVNDVITNLNEVDFFRKYYRILANLSEEERMVMQLSYDDNGYPGLTYNEIAQFLGVEKNKVANIKKRALKHVRKELITSKFI